MATASATRNDQRFSLATSPDAFGVWVPADRNKTTWPSFLDAAVQAGYSAIELGPYGYLPMSADQLSDELASRRLSLVGGYVTGLLHRSELEPEFVSEMNKVADLTNRLGAKNIVVLARAPAGEGRRNALNPGQWRLLVTNLLRINREIVERFGLRVAYHPHRDLAVETTGETSRLLNDTHGEVALCMDVGQFQSTDGDPVAFIKENGGLIRHVHIRDLDPVILRKAQANETPFKDLTVDGLFCEPGEGVVDLPGVAAALHDVKYAGPIVVERSPLQASLDEAREMAARSARYLVGLGIGSVVS